jgi:hypothetical protein
MNRVGAVQIAIICLTLATAAIHLYLGGPLFLVNGVVYVALLVLLYMPALRRFRAITRIGLIAFTVITIVFWALYTRFAPDPIGYADKIIEVLLVALLLLEMRQERTVSKQR